MKLGLWYSNQFIFIYLFFCGIGQISSKYENCFFLSFFFVRLYFVKNYNVKKFWILEFFNFQVSKNFKASTSLINSQTFE